MSTFQFWVGALCLLAMVSGVGSLWFSVRAGSTTTLRGQVRQLDLDLHELYDVVEKWTRRDRVRRFRDGQEAAMQAPKAPDRSDRAAYKAYLRQRGSQVAAPAPPAG